MSKTFQTFKCCVCSKMVTRRGSYLVKKNGKDERACKHHPGVKELSEQLHNNKLNLLPETQEEEDEEQQEAVAV